VPTAAPVVVLLYNRPGLTAGLLDMVRQARPRTLLVVADGPRPGVAGDDERCAEARRIATRVDWPCEVFTDFASENLGCARRTTTGLDWAFEQVDRAIVLEDDVRPVPSFFGYCDALLERYADDERIMHIDGGNRLGVWARADHDYHFARHGNVWGWATWRRAWNRYDRTLQRYRTPDARAAIDANALDPAHRELLLWFLDRDLASEVDAWDYQWTLARYATTGLSIVPSRNLVTNVGFGADATHTVEPSDLAAAAHTHSVELPLCGPEVMVADDELDRDLLRLERLRSIQDGVVAALMARALARPSVRARLAPNPAIASALVALEEPDVSLGLLRALARESAPWPHLDRLIADFERLATDTTRVTRGRG
jgi:hypothetical protein